MSITQDILNSMLPGQRFSAEELIDANEIDFELLRNKLSAALKAGFLKCERVYTITPIGVLKAEHIPVTRRSREEQKAIRAAHRSRHRVTRIATSAEYVEKRAAIEKERAERKAEAEQAKADRIAAKNAKFLERRAALLLKATPKPTVSRENVREAAQRAMRLAENVSLVAHAVRNVPNSVFSLGAR